MNVINELTNELDFSNKKRIYKSMFQVKGNKLIINSINVDFPYNIQDAIQVEDLVVVILGDTFDNMPVILMKEQPLNNVYAVNYNGELVWEIKEIISNGISIIQIFR